MSNDSDQGYECPKCGTVIVERADGSVYAVDTDKSGGDSSSTQPAASDRRDSRETGCVGEPPKLPAIAYLDDLGEPISPDQARLYDEELPELVRKADVLKLFGELINDFEELGPSLNYDSGMYLVHEYRQKIASTEKKNDEGDASR